MIIYSTLYLLECLNWLNKQATTGGNFHLIVGGGGKSSGNAGDPMLGVAVSGGYNHPNHKHCASPKRPFFFFLGFHVVFPIFRAFPVQILGKCTPFPDITISD